MLGPICFKFPVRDHLYKTFFNVFFYNSFFFRLDTCGLLGKSCEALASVVSLQISRLRVLDLSNNNLEDSGVMVLSAGLESPHCTMESLRSGTFRDLGICFCEDSNVIFVSSCVCRPTQRVLVIFINYCPGWITVTCQREVVELWAQLSAPRPLDWKSWTWAATTCRILELSFFLSDLEVLIADWKLSG